MTDHPMPAEACSDFVMHQPRRRQIDRSVQMLGWLMTAAVVVLAALAVAMLLALTA